PVNAAADQPVHDPPQLALVDPPAIIERNHVRGKNAVKFLLSHCRWSSPQFSVFSYKFSAHPGRHATHRDPPYYDPISLLTSLNHYHRQIIHLRRPRPKRPHAFVQNLHQPAGRLAAVLTDQPLDALLAELGAVRPGPLAEA